MKPNSKSYTGGTGPSTYVVTEWHAPRCLGSFVRSHYNGLGQLVMEQRPYQDWQHKIDGCGADDGLGSEIHVNYGYNSLGQQNHVSVPELKARATYDDALPADGSRWTGKNVTLTNYDPIGRPLETFAPNSERTYHTYGATGHATFQESRDSGVADKVVRWESVDLYGVLQQIRTYANSTTQDSRILLTHDGSGNLTKVVRELPDNVTLSTMTYDKAGRKLTMNDADLGNWAYDYDRQSNLKRQTDARSKTTCLYYEHALGRLAAKEFMTTTSCGAVASFDANNRPVVTGVAFDLQYFYDQNSSSSNRSLGQLTTIDYADNRWDKTIAYNSLGQLAKESVTITGTTLLSTTYQYDTYLRPWKTTYPDGEVLTSGYNSMGLPMTLTSGSNVTLTDSASYSVTGQLLSMRMPAGTSSTSDDVWRTQSYFPWSSGTSSDSNGRLKQILVGTSSGGNNRLNLSYGYDSFSNIKSITEGYNGGGTTANNFTYDAQNRLTNGYAKDYNYDAAGRMLKYEATSNNQTFNSSFPLHAIKNSSYVYDANGNMTTRVTPGGNQTLTWNNENHLTTVSGGGITTENYVYDADGNRVKKTVGSTNFYYPFPTYEISGTVAIKYYFFAGQRVAMKSGSTLTYLHGDHLGSTALATTSAGAWQSQEKYFAYGKDRDTANSVPTDHKFTGQKLDGSGLMYYGARFYDPQTGLFVSPDTIVPDAGNVFSYNRTMYVFGKPLTLIDPVGHCPWCIGAGVGAGVGGAMYLWSEYQQEDGIDLSVSVTWEDGWLPEVHGGNDWLDLGAAVGTGAVAGALLPVAAIEGIAGTAVGELVSSAGAGIASNVLADHVGNILTGDNFSAGDHMVNAAAGAATGILSPGLGEAVGTATKAYGPLTQEVAKIATTGLASGAMNNAANYVSVAGGFTDGRSGLVNDLSWGVIGQTFGQLNKVNVGNGYWETFLASSSEIVKTGTNAIQDELKKGPQ